MTNLLDEENGQSHIPAPPVTRPSNVPEKFWDTEKGTIHPERLWRSYQALERKLGAGERIVPESPEHYCLDCGDHEPDPDVNAVLHRAGFTNDQAQVVYDLARHYVVPELERREKERTAERVRGRLEEHFGGEERWAETARQLGEWGRAHLPADVLETMGASFEGVQALHRMMTSDEPGVGGRERAQAEYLDEKQLRALMDDPKYWRDHDPVLMTKVRDGFRKLYPG